MYRAATVREMQRAWDQERRQLLRMIEQLTNRVMYLADRPWELPEVESAPSPAEDRIQIHPELIPIED